MWRILIVCIAFFVRAGDFAETRRELRALPQPTYGGRDRHHVSQRIVGGEESQDGEWPWLVSIRHATEDDPEGAHEHLCGGTLIAPQWVVSAAHCFSPDIRADLSTNPADYTVRLGEYTMFIDEGNHVDYTPSMIIRHSGFLENNALTDDITLLKLPQAVRFSDRIKAAPLMGSQAEIPSSCTVAGWGHTEFEGEISPKVRHVEVSIIDIDTCRGLLGPDWEPFYPTWETVLCAGDTEEGGKDACQFDSGGPLVCRDEGVGKWLLTGIVSFGSGCGDKNSPGTYTKIPSFRNWIDSTILNN